MRKNSLRREQIQRRGQSWKKYFLKMKLESWSARNLTYLCKFQWEEPTNSFHIYTSFYSNITRCFLEAVPASHALTFFDNIDNVIGIEAEFVCVLSIIGIQSLALWHLRLGLGLGLGSAPCWGRPAGCLSPDPVERVEAGEKGPNRRQQHHMVVWSMGPALASSSSSPALSLEGHVTS